MAHVTYITFHGKEQTVELGSGVSLMEGAIQNDVEGIESICGGNCYCGMCRVYVAEAWRTRVGAAGDFELPVLEGLGEEQPGARLACQIQVSDALHGLVVHLPEKQG
ncbi:(2Fe-2S)-binding protein [Solimonas sp. K1W22B-7]|uniref:2Fe-2S iron-sulfur cluster-binding protein n=1 Tax=Solimonas sp. K1W22B-7 TaxID=2303331 RepID=UPI000E331D58|nr:2Fe-2S iron-sulfur cluster-binding protein [Solimonas sp. K1W22B-7]AXQ30501.1 (2Fe-2S)-binding protein [Solimonas sp. K1W22B-7]